MEPITKIENFNPEKSYTDLNLDKRKIPVYASDIQYTCSCEFGFNCDDPDFNPNEFVVGYKVEEDLKSVK
jgi:hypothetical protein